MSTYFAIFCATHDVYGPELRRGAGGLGFWKRNTGEPDFDGRKMTKLGADTAWAEFLNEHESCDLRLHNERVYLMEFSARGML